MRNLSGNVSGRLSAASTEASLEAPPIRLFSTERPFAFYIRAAPLELRASGLFREIFAKWPASWALQVLRRRRSQGKQSWSRQSPGGPTTTMTSLASRGLQDLTNRVGATASAGWRGGASVVSSGYSGSAVLMQRARSMPAAVLS